MRMMRWLVLMGLLVLPLFIGIGCATVPATKPEHLTLLVEGNNAFALDLFKRICADEPDKNVLISPYSISTALGMTYAGARGNTEKQMAEVLHFGLPQSELHSAFAELAGQMKLKKDAGCQLKIANALWGGKAWRFCRILSGSARRTIKADSIQSILRKTPKAVGKPSMPGWRNTRRIRSWNF